MRVLCALAWAGAALWAIVAVDETDQDTSRRAKAALVCAACVFAAVLLA